MTLAVQGVSKRYGDTVAVDDVAFEVPEGSIFGLLGANGAGKTTTVRMILDIIHPDSGASRGRGRRSSVCPAGPSATCPKNAASTRT